MSIGHVWRSERRKLRELIRSHPGKVFCVCVVLLQILGVAYTMMVLVASDGDVGGGGGVIRDVDENESAVPKPRAAPFKNLEITSKVLRGSLESSQSTVRHWKPDVLNNKSIAATSVSRKVFQGNGKGLTDDQDDMELEMESRVKRLREVCLRHPNIQRVVQRRGPSRSSPNNAARAGEFLIDPGHNLIWCSVFKAGASTMMYNFNLLAGYTKEQIRDLTADGKTLLMTLARKKFPRPTVQELQRAVGDGRRNTVFLVVRHPFERLVSAYRDKFLHAHKGSHHEKLGLRLISRYRSREAKKNLLEHPIYARKPTFEEFARLVIDEARLLRFDMHWEPYYRFCTPCQVAFNAVVKFETLERDLRFIFGKAGVLDIVDSGRRENRGSGESRDFAAEYFSQIPPQIFDKLMMIYAPDMEMFEYSPEPYRELMNKPAKLGSL